MREYYALYACDVHKSHSSMSLLGVFSEKKLKQTIRKKLKAKDFEFDGEGKEIKHMDIHDLQVHIDYCYIQSLVLNREL